MLFRSVRHTPCHTHASTCAPLEDSALARSGSGACAAQGGQALLKPQYAAHAAFSLHIRPLAFASTQTSYATTDAAHPSWRRSGECRMYCALRSARRSPARPLSSHEFYESDDRLTISIFDKGADPAQVSVKFEPRSVSPVPPLPPPHAPCR